MSGFYPRFSATAMTPDAQQRGFNRWALGADGLSEQARDRSSEHIARAPRRSWSKFITADNAHLCTPEALDFVDKVSPS
jgi:hypothetical protein